MICSQQGPMYAGAKIRGHWPSSCYHFIPVSSPLSLLYHHMQMACISPTGGKHEHKIPFFTLATEVPFDSLWPSFFHPMQCSVECGSGTQQREVICIRKTESHFDLLNPYECSFSERPPSQQPCYLKACGATWFSTEWSTVSLSAASQSSLPLRYPMRTHAHAPL